jgi:hypothetical protein
MPPWLSPVVLSEVLTAFVFGGMLFFAGAVAPMVFSKLPAAQAGRFIRQLFPVYYLVMAVGAGLAALAAAWTRPLDGTLLLVVTVGFVLAWRVLMPRINRLRDAEIGGERAARSGFARLHRVSVVLNAAQLLLVAVVLVRLAAAGV